MHKDLTDFLSFAYRIACECTKTTRFCHLPTSQAQDPQKLPIVLHLYTDQAVTLQRLTTVSAICLNPQRLG